MSDRSIPTSDQGSPRWQAAPAAQFDWAHWGDEHVLYHRPSGKTHFVNAATAQLLRTILTIPRTVDEVIEVLAAGVGTEEIAELRERTTEQLLRLEDLGLVTVS